ncbi:hypothetical protein E3N88_00393 [Mikania micrantha]|uniref:Uncharacterized protein n=1 Tax=Mikania micrantha TaxID=192012 RepID=A0A5N6PZD8_9ASTR|nr:hypothetical protein E3N88_00393 [Mikania micrantha]
MYKLLRFLVGRRSKLSQTALTTEIKNNINNMETPIDCEGQDLFTNAGHLKLATAGQHKLEQSNMSLQDRPFQARQEFEESSENKYIGGQNQNK